MSHYSITELINLKALYVNDNPSLTYIKPEIYKLSRLKVVECVGCELLVTPPYAVCLEGAQVVKNYLTSP